MDLDAAAIGLATKNETGFRKAKELLNDVLLRKPGKRAWAFVQEYYKEHGQLPPPSVVKEQTGFRAEAEEGTAIDWVVDQLLDRHKFRSIEHGLSAGLEALEQGNKALAEEEVHKLSEHLRGLSLSKGRIHTLADVAPEVLALYERAKRGETGIEFPWPTMTRTTMGMWPGTLTMFVARPSVGKSWTMVLVCMCAAFEQKLKVLLVSPEMNRVELGERFVVKHGSYNYSNVVSGQLGIYAEPHFINTVDELGKSQEAKSLYILDDEDKLEPSFIEEAIDATEADLVGIDSAYMLKVAQGGVKSGAGSRGDRQERMVATVDWMRSTSRRKQKAICAISQLARTGRVKKSAKETLKKGLGTGGLEDTLAFSDALYQDCHNLYALYQDEDMKLDRQMLFVPLKARRQAAWSAVVTRWDMEEMDFEELGTSVLMENSEEEEFDDKGHDFIY